MGKLEDQESNLWVPGPSQAKSLSIVPDPAKQTEGPAGMWKAPSPGEGVRPREDVSRGVCLRWRWWHRGSAMRVFLLMYVRTSMEGSWTASWAAPYCA